MNHPEPLNNKQRKPIVKYFMVTFYFLFIGFCTAGIIIKWDNINTPTQKQYAFAEGHSVTVRAPTIKRPSFLERLTRRKTEARKVKLSPVKLPERFKRADATWQQYAANTVNVPAGHDTVILVIDDLGILKDTTQAMIDIDAPLTLAFLPYASEINRQVNDAYNKGHDILVHIPMEPKSKLDPGPNALRSSTSARVQMDSINYNLSQFTNYIGINNHMGSRFTEDSEAVNRLLDVVKDKGLLVLDSKTTANSLLEDLALKKQIPVTNRDVFLDNEQDVDYIMGQLRKLERVAKSNGTAIAIGHPYTQTVTALRRWIPTLANKNITIIPISQNVKQKYAKTLLANK